MAVEKSMVIATRHLGNVPQLPAFPARINESWNWPFYLFIHSFPRAFFSIFAFHFG